MCEDLQQQLQTANDRVRDRDAKIETLLKESDEKGSDAAASAPLPPESCMPPNPCTSPTSAHAVAASASLSPRTARSPTSDLLPPSLPCHSTLGRSLFPPLQEASPVATQNMPAFDEDATPKNSVPSRNASPNQEADPSDVVAAVEGVDEGELNETLTEADEIGEDVEQGEVEVAVQSALACSEASAAVDESGPTSQAEMMNRSAPRNDEQLDSPSATSENTCATEPEVVRPAADTNLVTKRRRGRTTAAVALQEPRQSDVEVVSSTVAKYTPRRASSVIARIKCRAAEFRIPPTPEIYVRDVTFTAAPPALPAAPAPPALEESLLLPKVASATKMYRSSVSESPFRSMLARFGEKLHRKTEGATRHLSAEKRNQSPFLAILQDSSADESRAPSAASTRLSKYHHVAPPKVAIRQTRASKMRLDPHDAATQHSKPKRIKLDPPRPSQPVRVSVESVAPLAQRRRRSMLQQKVEKRKASTRHRLCKLVTNLIK